jgi:hypothetical protein
MPQARGLPAGLPLRRGDEDAWDAQHSKSLEIVLAIVLMGMLPGWWLWRQARARRGGMPATPRDWRQWLGGSSRPGGLKLMQSLRLTPRSTLHVLQWDGEELLVGCSDTGVSVLARRAPGGYSVDSHEPTGTQKAP